MKLHPMLLCGLAGLAGLVHGGTIHRGNIHGDNVHVDKFVKVDLGDESDHIAGRELFPRHVIQGTKAKYSRYADNATGWATEVLNMCKTFDHCNSTISYLTPPDESTGESKWIGFAFSGSATTPLNYTQYKGVQGSIAYTLNPEWNPKAGSQ